VKNHSKRDWRVSVTGDEYDLEILAERFRTDDLRITRVDSGGYELSSQRFDLCEDATQVMIVARALLREISGLIRLMLGAGKSLRPSHVFLVNEAGGGGTGFIGLGCQVNMRSSVEITVHKADGTVVRVDRKADLTDIFALADDDREVRQALQILEDEMADWVAPYKLFEVIRDSCGGEGQIVKRKWAAMEGIKLFVKSANSPEASGHLARHAISDGYPPKSPMSLPDGRHWIQQLCHHWLSEKLALAGRTSR
jgi:hypothetical protein